jgi:hypothetical protein
MSLYFLSPQTTQDLQEINDYLCVHRSLYKGGVVHRIRGVVHRIREVVH